MNSTPSEPLGSGIQYERIVPIEVEVADEADLQSGLTQYNADNERVLKTILLWDDRIVEHGDDNTSHDDALLQLDFKINIVMELLGYYLSQNNSFPKARKVMLNSSGLQWSQVTKPDYHDGDYLLVRVYLKQEYPKPLVFPTRCESVAKGNEGYQITSNFFGLNDSVVDYLDKLIFREHRRNIALRKPVK